MDLCPKCRGEVRYNWYFSRYACLKPDCGWMENAMAKIVSVERSTPTYIGPTEEPCEQCAELLEALEKMVSSCPYCDGTGQIEDAPKSLLPTGGYAETYTDCFYCLDAQHIIAKAKGEGE